MARKVKFPLKMADGYQVRTLEELKDHFNLICVLGYYDNGRLTEWLLDRYYEEEAEIINALDSTATEFKMQLCEVLGVPYTEIEASNVDLTDIAVKNERLEKLKLFTADEKILAAVDRVAFSQEDLANLLDKGALEIYLCGERFDIPGNNEGVTYRGVNNPRIHPPYQFIPKGIEFYDVEINADDIIHCMNEAKDLTEIASLWRMAAERGHAEAQFNLGDCYENGKGVEKDADDAVKWYRKSAEQGWVDAQNTMGNIYSNGYGVEQNDKEAVKWYLKAANNGNMKAQNSLGIKYANGKGVEQSYEEANKWYSMAAEQGYDWAQHNLGINYRDGNGIEKNIEEAIKWLDRAMKQGNESAKNVLIELAPKLVKASDVIIYAIGGRLNLFSKFKVETENIDVSVYNRHKINEALLREYGATGIWVESLLDEDYDPTPTVKELTHVIGGFIKDSIKTRFTNEPPDLFVIEPKYIDNGKGVVHITLPDITPEIQEDLDNIQISSI